MEEIFFLLSFTILLCQRFPWDFRTGVMFLFLEKLCGNVSPLQIPAYLKYSTFIIHKLSVSFHKDSVWTLGLCYWWAYCVSSTRLWAPQYLTDTLVFNSPGAQWLYSVDCKVGWNNQWLTQSKRSVISLSHNHHKFRKSKPEPCSPRKRWSDWCKVKT